jgi:hypothetical protein
MFGIFFIDSLGFLRIIDTPILIDGAWQSVEATPRTIAGNTAISVALSGWTATFLSTALAIRWHTQGMPLDEHLRLVQALALLFLLAMLTLAALGRAAPGERRS